MIRSRRIPALAAAVFALCVAVVSLPTSAATSVAISVAIAPPALPVYAQPLCPGPGYIWTPGYWAYGPAGYYWVPGTWVLAPFVGALWTPGYWGWVNGLYVWHAGYWGPRVGFYGGVNYGFGYFGVGYQGGYWRDNNFYYNRTVNNVNVTTINNVYRTNVIAQPTSRVSYNGGPSGIARQPNAVERAAESERHVAFTESQQLHEQSAANNRAMLSSVNRGRPTIAATPAPGSFDHPNVVSARGATNVQGNPGGPPRMANTGAPPQQMQRSAPTHVAPAAPTYTPKVEGAGNPHGAPHGEGRGGGGPPQHEHAEGQHGHPEGR
jgi:hypothetical protein